MSKWKNKNNKVKIKTRWGGPTKENKRGKSKKHDERKERYNYNDPKYLNPWNTLWAYKSLSFIAKKS